MQDGKINVKAYCLKRNHMNAFSVVHAQNWVELIPHIIGLVLTILSGLNHSKFDLQDMLIFVLLGLAVSSLHAKSAPLISGAILFMNLMISYHLWIEDGMHSFGDAAYSAIVSLLGIFAYQYLLSQSWHSAIVLFDIEIILITCEAPLGTTLSVVIVLVIALFCKYSGVVLCLHEAFLFFAAIVSSLQHIMNITITQMPGSPYVCTDLDVLQLVLTITTIGVIVTLLIGVISGYAIYLSSSRLSGVGMRSGCFCVVALSGVFGVMFPLMQIPIVHCFPHIRHPLEWMGEFLLREGGRAGWICVYWITSLAVSLPLAQWVSSRFSSDRLPQICARKIFHFLCVLMFAPIIDVDLPMLALSMGVATCLLLVVEFIRCFDVFAVSETPLALFFDMFMDERDRQSVLALTHIELLLGCAAPVWLWSVLLISLPSESIPHCLRFLPHIGWITVGVGDAMAAVVGSFYGNTKWIARDNRMVRAGWHVSPSVLKRSVEGSVGCLLGTLTVSGVVVCFQHGIYGSIPDVSWGVCILLSMISAGAVETLTGDRDNIVMPLAASVVYLSMCKMLRM